MLDSNWISVDERLPEIHDKYLVFFPCAIFGDKIRYETIPYVDIIAYNDNGWWLRGENKNMVVSHWMPLPTFPKE
jgi:hypothetical protein